MGMGEKAVSVPHHTDPLQLDDLPPELCMMILDFLPASSLDQLRMVSRAWKDKASDPLLVCKFHAVMEMDMTEERILMTVSSKPSLLTMTVDGRQVTDKILEAAWEHPTLHTLRVVETEGVNYKNNKLGFLHVYEMVWRKQLFSSHHAEVGRQWNNWSRLPQPQTTLAVCAKPGSEVTRGLDVIYELLRKRMEHD